MKVLSHKAYAQRGVEEVIIEDCHGRQKHIQVQIFGGPDPDALIQKEIDEFQAQEEKLTKHLEARFDPKTMERKQ